MNPISHFLVAVNKHYIYHSGFAVLPLLGCHHLLYRSLDSPGIYISPVVLGPFPTWHLRGRVARGMGRYRTGIRAILSTSGETVALLFQPDGEWRTYLLCNICAAIGVFHHFHLGMMACGSRGPERSKTVMDAMDLKEGWPWTYR
jgi:hypothetical protein